jgi:predicted permease
MGVLLRLFRRRRFEAQLEAELRDHLDRQVADYVRDGVDEAEARRRANLELGGLEQVKEACRDARGTRLLDDLVQDLRFGVRVLRKSPGFTLVAVLSLALGIGANTAIFTLVDTLVLRALPVREPSRLVRLDDYWTNPIWEEVHARQHQVLESAAAFSETRFDLAAGGETNFVEGLFVSGDFFEVAGVPAILGRTLTNDDDRRGGGPGGPVALISYGFWQRRFGGAADVVGRSLSLNDVPFTIVGVTPPAFFGPSVGRAFEVAVPLSMVDRVQHAGLESWLDGRSMWWLEILGRLKPGETADVASRALQRLQAEIREATLPADWRPQDLRDYLGKPLTFLPAATGFSEARGEYERALFTVMVAVVLVLLIACANLASLLIARTSARRQELAARLALGASRRRLARQLLTEALLLSVAGAVLGVLLAHWAGPALLAQITVRGGPTSAAPVALDLSLHWRVLLFTLAATISTAVLFGLLPALRVGELSPHEAIKSQGRSLVGEDRSVRGARLVVAQVALSLVLAFIAGLFLRSFARLAHRDLGLRSEGILLVNLDAQRSPVPRSQHTALFARVQEAVAAVPGVAGAAVSVVSPVSGGGWNMRFEALGFPSPGDRESVAWCNAVTPGWFSTYGTPLLAGRDFDGRDRLGAPRVAVVNDAFARRFLAGQSPVGRALVEKGPPGRPETTAEIVGVVKDAVYRSARDPMEPIVYYPLAQLEPDHMWSIATVGVRAASGSPARLTRGIVTAVGAVDPRLSLTFRLFSEQVGATMMRERLVAWLSAFFGGLALLLAGIGLHGVTAYSVSRRRTEIGVRMALGAEASGVVRMVLGRALRLAGWGVAIGVAASLAGAQLLRSLLFGLEPRDLPTLLAAAATLLAVCLLSAGLPARRASRIDPVEVLREG